MWNDIFKDNSYAANEWPKHSSQYQQRPINTQIHYTDDTGFSLTLIMYGRWCHENHFFPASSQIFLRDHMTLCNLLTLPCTPCKV